MSGTSRSTTNVPEDAATGAAATPANTPEPSASTGTKNVVWKEGSLNHARIVSPDSHGVSREYRFDRDNDHEVAMDEADAAVLMSGPDKGEFRLKRS